jgi:uncharacterized protein YjbJ (UPF0337 family)
MNKHYLEGKWDEVKGVLKKNWGELTKNDSLEIEGKRDVLYGKLISAYGWSKEKAQKKVNKFYS